MTRDDVPSGPPPVEPMSDVAWARVERGLMARLDSPTAIVAPPAKRNPRWLAIPAIVAAAAIAIVLIGRRDDAPAPESQPVATYEPSRVVAGDAPSSVSFGDAHVALDARTAIVMSYEGGSPSVLVEHGSSLFTVAPRAGRPPFVVRAGDTIVRVVGTQFRVTRADERVAVFVDHGIVEVLYRGNTVRVGASQEWHSEAPEAVTTIALAPPPPPPPQITAPPPTTTSPPPPTTKPAVDTDRAKYDRLVGLEARDPAAAITGYLELSRGNSKWSAVALYSAGRLAADRNDARAATFLTIYLRRFPTGANARDARTLLDRINGGPR